MKFRRGFQIEEGTRVLIVEDIVSTGGSIVELINLLREYKADLVGVICIVDRSQKNIVFDARFESLLNFPSESWEESECPEWLLKKQIVKPGSTGK